MQLVIANTEIRRDSRGRYCLNDLHRAAGGASKHLPSKWLANKQTDDLIREYEITGIPVIESKQQLGTFVAKDLVYDYAMWISPAFKVKVIQTFDRVQSGNLPALPQTFAEALQLAATQAKQIEDQNTALLEMQPKAAFFDAVTDSKTAIDMAIAAKTLNLGFGRNTLFQILRDKGILDSRNIPYQQFCSAGYFRVVESSFEKKDGTVCVSFKTVVYQKGLDFIRRKLAEGREAA